MASLLLGKTACDQIEYSLTNTVDELTKKDIVSSIAVFREVYSKLDLWANETNIGANTKRELDTIINGIAALNELTVRLSDSFREYIKAERDLWQNSKSWKEMPTEGHCFFYDEKNVPSWKLNQ